MNKSLLIGSVIKYLNLETDSKYEIIDKVLLRLNLLKTIYRIPIFFLIYFLLIMNKILFFIPSDKYFFSIIKLFNFFGGPFSLFIKLISSYILLEYYEEN